MAKKRRRVVQLKRTMKKGAIGIDVVSLKRALRRADCFPKQGELTRQYGKKTIAGVKAFQKECGLPTDGIYGPRTHRKLMRQYDAWGALLMSRSPGPEAATDIRQKVVAEALWGYNNQYRISYEQVRPMRSLNKGHRLPQVADCSEFATVVYKRAGAPDPNRFLYNGAGYTGTLAQHGIFVARSQARPGDLVFYGSGFPWHHVAIYVGQGRVVSLGSDSGPNLCDVDYRSDRGAIRSYLP
jgi:peptidoglycan hydrolase-like protein with peptidoglycan-binding domain